MQKKTTELIVQIYEIQTTDEARAMIDLGVDHIGSVITAKHRRHDASIRDAVDLVRRMGAVSSLIPLYTDADAVLDTLDYYRPHIVHFCDALDGVDSPAVDTAISLQTAVKRAFPDVDIMRSIPIAQAAADDEANILEVAARLEPVSDYFLTDTVIDTSGNPQTDQPVAGFVGITGLTCDWNVAARLVEASRIPVILAGGISPENAAEGIRTVRPFGVDSCTCTNAREADGRPIRFRKDPSRVKALVQTVRGSAKALSDSRSG
jgi:phosphoribosylanthranilate isomerase